MPNMSAPPGRFAGELAFWEAVGRPVRTGTWTEQAEPTPDRIATAISEGRPADAAALARHLVVEAQELHDLYTAWCGAIPRILAREGHPVELGTAVDQGAGWQRFRAAANELAERSEAGEAGEADVEALVALWREEHDRSCDLVAAWLGLAVEKLGEERLGELWSELQADGIDFYDRYDSARNPWPRSRALLLQIAIEGMHGHLTGPRRRGEVEVTEHEDRVELRFEPCGSGGRLRAEGTFGVTEQRWDWAWNEVGVCHYCVHCCVLQQLTPIQRLGFPARVIDPPLQPGGSCTWTVYHDPSLVPEEAYRRVGQRKPRAGDADG